MRLFPLFLRHTPVGDCTSSEDVPDAWSLSPSDPIFRFSWTISALEKGRNGWWRAKVDRWGRCGGNRAGLMTSAGGKKYPLGHFYELFCSHWAPGWDEQRVHKASVLGWITLTDWFGLLYCHRVSRDKSIHNIISRPKQTQALSCLY